MSARLYVIEGVDGTGKTTLSRFIARKLADQGKQVFLYHATLVAPQQELYHANILANAAYAMRGLDAVAILDRSWPSCIAYGTALKNQELFNPSAHADLVRSYHGTYIYADCESCAGRYNGDASHPYTKEQHALVRRNYEALFRDLADDGLDNITSYDMDVSGSDLLSYCNCILGFDFK